MRWIVVLCAGVLIGLTPLSAQEVSPTSTPGVIFEPLSSERLDTFYGSLRAHTVFSLPESHPTPVVDPLISGIWAGSSTDFESQLGEVTLRFRPRVEARLTSDALAESVDVRVAIVPKGLSITHTLAQNSIDRTGILAKFSSQRQSSTRTTFVPGESQSGMYFSVPPMFAVGAQRAWGVLVCPRELKVTRVSPAGHGYIELLPSPYELTEWNVSLSARVNATVSSASDKQRLSARLGVSGDLPEPITGADEVISKAPTIALSYRPAREFDFIKFAPKSHAEEGVRATIEMQNKAGYLRRQYFEHVVHVLKSTEPSPISVIVNATQPRKNEGVCYVLISTREAWKEFERQPTRF